jgi:hypothetical protein
LRHFLTLTATSTLLFVLAIDLASCDTESGSVVDDRAPGSKPAYAPASNRDGFRVTGAIATNVNTVAVRCSGLQAFSS